MNWNEIKKSIIDGLINRNLTQPRRRIGELHNIERSLQENMPEFIDDAQASFGAMDKEEFKERYALLKSSGELNSAEKSIINEIYYRINQN